jgi:DNA-binding response OmpR family regulator
MPEKLTHKLLLLEDDLNLNETISDFLNEAGFTVTSVYSGEDAQDTIYENHFDLLLLDVNVPPPNGFELLKIIRDQDVTAPAIFLTSRNGMDDLETGYEVGCDDYIRKPFALKELLLRIQTLLKRNFYHSNSDQISLSTDISYDTKAQTLYHHGKPLKLHQKEQKLLQLFLQHKNEALSHETIMQHLWGFDEEPSDASLRSYIKNLRKILGKESIESIKRYGYKFSSQ